MLYAVFKVSLVSFKWIFRAKKCLSRHNFWVSFSYILTVFGLLTSHWLILMVSNGMYLLYICV